MIVVDTYKIPEGFLCVCEDGHITAPGWLGQTQDPEEPGRATGRLCPRAVSPNNSYRALLCQRLIVPIAGYPVLQAAYRLGGEAAVAELVLSGDIEIAWPERPMQGKLVVSVAR